jgi:hypothetical protein
MVTLAELGRHGCHYPYGDSGGTTSTNQAPTAREIDEIYCGLDLQGQGQNPFNGRGFPLYYRVMIEKKNRKMPTGAVAGRNARAPFLF